MFVFINFFQNLDAVFLLIKYFFGLIFILPTQSCEKHMWILPTVLSILSLVRMRTWLTCAER